MQLVDFRLECPGEIRTDVCIIGSGPAGLTVARELTGSGLSVVMLESGGLGEGPAHPDEIERSASSFMLNPGAARNRRFGGTTATWSGRCIPLDDLDYQSRPWIPHSGWPFAGSEMEEFATRAAHHLGILPATACAGLVPPAGEFIFDRNVLSPVRWQFSFDQAAPRDHLRLGTHVLRQDQTDALVLLHATATEIELDGTGRLAETVRIANMAGRRGTVRAGAIVLAAGAIENARLLMCSDRVVEGGIGNGRGLVGRFLMDHPRGLVADFDPASRTIRRRYGHHRVTRGRRRLEFLDGFSLAPAFQERMQTANAAAWLFEERADRTPMAALARLASRRSPHRRADLGMVLRHPRSMVRSGIELLVHGHRAVHPLRRLGLMCIVEQVPDPANRVRRGSRRDALGMPIVGVDWRIGDLERDTASILAQTLADEFARAGLPAPALADWIRTADYDACDFYDVSHPAGTTRMADDPSRGVVDRNGAVHGVDGLFVAGSSTFPTCGHANPTMMVMAMAIRLADHLRSATRTRSRWSNVRAFETAVSH